jgi:MinD-like ATPase involved in chromosome partitioning or flagellar assembly
VKIVTFYSYKGGVGRTLALANVARIMAHQGDRVLLVDFDLEAPGLSILPLGGNGDVGPRVPVYGDGVLEYIAGGLLAEPVDPTHLVHATPGEADLFLMPAGDLGPGSDYSLALDRADFGRFYNEGGGAKLRDLFADLAQRHRLTYILIDSRTGYSDYGWLCLLDLPDIVVVVTSLNRQNLQGTSSILRTISEQKQGKMDHVVLAASLVPEGEEDLKERRFAEAARLFEAKPEFDVAIPYNSRVSLLEDLTFLKWRHSALADAYRELAGHIRRRNPDDRLDLRRQAFEAFERGVLTDLDMFRRAAAANPRDPQVHTALGMALGTSTDYRGATSTDYRGAIAAFRKAAELIEQPEQKLVQLTNAMLACLRLLTESRPRVTGETALEVSRGAQVDAEIVAALGVRDGDLLGAWVTRLQEVAQCLADAGYPDEAAPLWVEMAARYRVFLELRPADPRALNNLAAALTWLSDREQGEKRERTLAEAVRVYREALRAMPDDPISLAGLAGALAKVAGTKEGDERGRLLAESVAHCEAALAASPRHADALHNLAAALCDLAEQREGEERARLLEEAIQRYRDALAARPGEAATLHNLGGTFSLLAELREGEEQERLLEQAVQYYRDSLAARRGDAVDLSNLAGALLRLAQRKDGGERDRLLAEAVKACRGSLDASPGHVVALHNLGTALAWQAEREQDEERHRLLAEAAQCYRDSLAAGPKDADGLNRLGNILLRLGREKEGQERARLLAEAAECCRRSLEARPGDADALASLGVVLFSLAEREKGDDEARLLAGAVGYYRDSLAVRPNNAEILNILGSALFRLAGHKQGEARESLLAEAVQSYRDSLIGRPDDAETLSNLGITLAHLAYEKPGPEGESLWTQAFAALDEAGPSEMGMVAYNRACALALKGDAPGALAALAKAVERDTAARDVARDDPDFVSLRDDPRFQELTGRPSHAA